MAVRDLRGGTAEIEYSADAPNRAVWMTWEGQWSDDATTLWLELGRPGLGVGWPPGGSLDFLDHLDGLKELHGVGTFTDDTAVERAVALEKLILRNHAAQRPRRLDLSRLKALKELEVSDDLAEESLKRLPVSSLHYVEWAWPTLAPLAGCRSLRRLILESPRGLRSLSFEGAVQWLFTVEGVAGW